MSTDDGTILSLCETPVGMFHGSWMPDGRILVSTQNHVYALTGNVCTRLEVVDAEGGGPTQWDHGTSLGWDDLILARRGMVRDSGEPGATDRGSAYVGTVEADGKLHVRPTATDLEPVGTSGRDLVFVRNRDIYVQGLKSDGTLSGEPARLAGPVGRAGGDSQVSLGGTRLVYLADDSGRGSSAIYQYRWFSRNGTPIGEFGAPMGTTSSAAISRVDGRVAFANDGDIWLSTPNGAPLRLTSSPAFESRPVLAPDGRFVAFFGDVERGGRRAPWTVPAVGGATPLRLPGLGQVTDWSPDGQYLAVDIFNEASFVPSDAAANRDIALRTTASDALIPVLSTKFDELGARFSPDGRWIVYMSDEAGAFNVYVRSLEEPFTTWRVSPNGGEFPRWRGDGREIYFKLADGPIVVVAVQDLEKGLFSPPQKLFSVPIRPAGPQAAAAGVYAPYDVTADGQRFLIAQPVGREPRLVLITNWQSLRRRPTN